MPQAIEPFPRLGHLLMAGAMVVLLTGVSGVAQAQDRSNGPEIRSTLVRPASAPRKLRRASQATGVRSLTINRRPETASPEDFDDGENSATVDGPTRYNSIATFDPVPYVDSGLQYPYGLDGVGGYGSDFGVRAGQDTALYERGP